MSTLTDGTVILPNAQIPSRKLSGFYPGASDSQLALLSKMSMTYPPEFTFVYAGTSRENNKTSFFQVLEGSLELGFTSLDKDTGTRFRHVFTIRSDKKSPSGIYFAPWQQTNHFDLRSGKEGLRVLKMPVDFVSELLLEARAAVELFSKMQQKMAENIWEEVLQQSKTESRLTVRIFLKMAAIYFQAVLESQMRSKATQEIWQLVKGNDVAPLEETFRASASEYLKKLIVEVKGSSQQDLRNLMVQKMGAGLCQAMDLPANLSILMGSQLLILATAEVLRPRVS